MSNPNNYRLTHPELSAMSPSREDTSSLAIPDEFPTVIRATDLGEFWTDRGEVGEDDVLLCCSDPDGSDQEAVQPDSLAMNLMREIARRYNAHAELLSALRLIADTHVPDGSLQTSAQRQKIARVVVAKAEGRS